jgi:uncharacterized protein YbjT (DUF2867 family)
MADLSELLGDLYGETPSPVPPSRPDGASRPSPVLDDDLASALSAALSEAPRLKPTAGPPGDATPSPTPPDADGDALAPPPAPPRMWQRSDDDILPGRSRR